MYKLFLFFSILFSSFGYSQEFKCHVTVDASGIRGTNKQVFKTLEKSLENLINTTQWTDLNLSDKEKIKGDLILNIKSFDPKKNSFESELFFRIYRPVYMSEYQTLILNLIDKKFDFNYKEFQNLDFNPDFIDNNLTAGVAFFAYIGLGHYFDTFKEKEGIKYFQLAENIQKSADQNNMRGWEAKNKGIGKGDLIEALVDPQNSYYHRALYTYHRWGLDKMADNPKMGKSNILTAINYLSKLKQNNENASYLIKIFFDAKADEITQIFIEGPPVNINYIVNKLNNLAPQYSQKWDEIKKSATNNKVRPPLKKIPAIIKEK
jgi:hypothetical protein